MSEKELALFLRWLLKHYSTKTIDGGMFCYVDSMDKEVSMETIIKHYLDHIGDTNEMVEISDEKIMKAAEYEYEHLSLATIKNAFVHGATWYREQLKNKK